MRLILVRHGESIGNKKRISQGHADFDLTDKGFEQAECIARRLKDMDIDAAYSSDLKRARHTAETILRYHPHIELEFDSALREFTKGDFDGKPGDEKEAHKKIIIGPHHKYTWPNGESFEDVQRRMIGFYARTLEKHKKDTVLIVSHGGTITTLQLHLLDQPFEKSKEYHPKNTGISIIDIDDKKNIRIKRLNCIEHLT